MKVKLLETVQGAGLSGALPNGKTVTVLEPGETYEVGQALGEWLVEHRKAEEVTSTPTKAAGKVVVVADPEPVSTETAEPESEHMMSTKSHGQETPKRTRRTK